jgi:hypothetical protein
MAADEASTASDDDGSFRTHDICFFSNTDLSDLHGVFATRRKKTVLSVSIRVQ